MPRGAKSATVRRLVGEGAINAIMDMGITKGTGIVRKVAPLGDPIG